MTPLERMAEAYWNAFRDGFARVGGNPKEYPVWRKGPPDVTDETLRCMRHGVEALREVWGKPFDEVFPDKPGKRSVRRTRNDEAMAGKLK